MRRIFLIILVILCVVNIGKCGSSSSIEVTYPTGKDTALIIGNGNYQIMNCSNQFALLAYDGSDQDNPVMYTVLNRARKYVKKDGKVYVINDRDEAAIVTVENNHCIVCSAEYDTYERDNIYTKEEMNLDISVLKSIDDLSETDREIIKKLQTKKWYGKTLKFLSKKYPDDTD